MQPVLRAMLDATSRVFSAPYTLSLCAFSFFHSYTAWCLSHLRVSHIVIYPRQRTRPCDSESLGPVPPLIFIISPI
ncbi:hypothetical protein FIBSPDRAFT_279305 [Athelia psychrophila]|uniref:Uncharacterized protein n=1 Tax=Athelia psychrophila TaxID=1759441 RepID=A0A165WLA8_9AGAM|nr:hypothetical protein FIBSPDRAFT_279305 [Fibularhizoctonia sp. CBS 109695]